MDIIIMATASRILSGLEV